MARGDLHQHYEELEYWSAHIRKAMQFPYGSKAYKLEQLRKVVPRLIIVASSDIQFLVGGCNYSIFNLNQAQCSTRSYKLLENKIHDIIEKPTSEILVTCVNLGEAGT